MAVLRKKVSGLNITDHHHHRHRHQSVDSVDFSTPASVSSVSDALPHTTAELPDDDNGNNDNDNDDNSDDTESGHSIYSNNDSTISSSVSMGGPVTDL